MPSALSRAGNQHTLYKGTDEGISEKGYRRPEKRAISHLGMISTAEGTMDGVPGRGDGVWVEVQGGDVLPGEWEIRPASVSWTVEH